MRPAPRIAARLIPLAIALAAAPAATAHGDPASDYLIEHQVFYAFDAEIPSDEAQRLITFVADANRAGFTIRLAIIRTKSDLGSEYRLHGKPQRYAEFLGNELQATYRSRLLIVMPNGFGYAVGGRPAPAGRRALIGLAAPGNDGTRLADAATLAVQRLARAARQNLPLPKAATSTENSDRIKIGAIAVTCAALLAAATLVRRGRRAARQ